MPIQHSVRHGRRHMLTYLLSIVLSVVLAELSRSAMPLLMHRLHQVSAMICWRLGLSIAPDTLTLWLIGIAAAFLIGLFHGYNDWKERMRTARYRE